MFSKVRQQSSADPGPGHRDFNLDNHDFDGERWWSKDRSSWWDGSHWTERPLPSRKPTSAITWLWIFLICAGVIAVAGFGILVIIAMGLMASA